jgi:hypothetical protein
LDRLVELFVTDDATRLLITVPADLATRLRARARAERTTVSALLVGTYADSVHRQAMAVADELVAEAEALHGPLSEAEKAEIDADIDAFMARADAYFAERRRRDEG